MSLRVFIFAAMTVAAAGAGCAKKKPPGPNSQREWEISRPPPTTTTTRQRALAIKAPVTLVKQGAAPLVYLVETGDPIYIIVSDLTQKQDLARVPVTGRTIVRVEALGGVLIGTDSIHPGPLPANHVFGISVEAVQESVMRHEITQPQRGGNP